MSTTASGGATRHEGAPDHAPEERGPRRTQVLAVLAVVVPPLAWLVSLAGSYVGQDFTCSAFASAARPGPGGAVLTFILVVNTLLLLLTLLAGWVGWTRWQRGEGAERFLGLVAILSVPFFALGIVLIALPSIFLEVCP